VKTELGLKILTNILRKMKYVDLKSDTSGWGDYNFHLINTHSRRLMFGLLQFKVQHTTIDFRLLASCGIYASGHVIVDLSNPNSIEFLTKKIKEGIKICEELMIYYESTDDPYTGWKARQEVLKKKVDEWTQT
jgi:hypothetical protein